MGKIKNNGSTEIDKRGPLGGSIPMSGDRDYSSEAIKKELKDKSLSATENIVVKNEVTGKETSLTIHRDGTPDSKLVLALADPNLTRDQKDHVMSMYLYERGKDSSSFIVDIMRYKGQHTKETRAFTSQMRFDFEMFVNMFTEYLDSSARSILLELDNLGRFDYTIENLVRDYKAYLKEDSHESITSFFASAGHTISPEKAGLVQIAVRMHEEAALLRSTTQKITEARMKEKGFGIYLGTDGRPYSMFGNENEVEEAVAKDRIRIEELKKELK